MNDLSTLEQEIFTGFANLKSKTDLENFKIEILGKKGKLSKLFQDLATIEKDKKKRICIAN
jgi:phenylalanyl-tRNA synthetase alpha subunit